jgi:hypothetical protein
MEQLGRLSVYGQKISHNMIGCSYRLWRMAEQFDVKLWSSSECYLTRLSMFRCQLSPSYVVLELLHPC